MHSKLAESELKVFLREFGNTTYLPIAIGKWRVFFKVVCIDWETKICVFNTLLRQNKLLGNLQLAGCGFLQFSKFLNLSFKIVYHVEVFGCDFWIVNDWCTWSLKEQLSLQICFFDLKFMKSTLVIDYFHDRIKNIQGYISSKMIVTILTKLFIVQLL